jgi:hypothetical protein
MAAYSTKSLYCVKLELPLLGVPNVLELLRGEDGSSNTASIAVRNMRAAELCRKLPLDAIMSGARSGRASELRGCVVPNTTEKYFLLGTCLKLCSQILNTKRNLCMESRYLEPRFEPLTRPGSPQPNSLERLDDYQKVARSQPWQR